MGRSYDRRDPRRVDGGLRGGIGFGALGELAAQEVLSLAQEIYPGMYSVVENGPDQLDALPPTALTIGRSPSEDVDAGFYGVLRLPDRGPQQSTL